LHPIESDIRGDIVFGKELTLNLKSFATQFVELCNQGKNFDITRKATGERVNLREVAVYTVQDEKITREQFFYDGVR
jgi:hypothetical protein